MINIFSPHASKLLIPVMKLVFRCLDRGCCFSIMNCCRIEKTKEETEADEDGTGHDVHTKKLTQYDLNALYTGDQISSHYVYAQNYTYLFCVMMFSTGLPILYPFACIAFFVLYWVYKFLLLKYYEKTTKFNEELPIYSITWIKFSILIHGVFGLFMYTNNDLFPPNDPYAGRLDFVFQRLGGWGTLFKERFFTRSYTTIYFLFWVGVLVWFVAKPTVLKLFWKIVSCTCKNLTDSCRNDEDEKSNKAHSDNFFAEITIAPLKDMLDTAYDEHEHEAQRQKDNEGFDQRKLTKDANPHRFPEEVAVKPNAFFAKLT